MRTTVHPRDELITEEGDHVVVHSIKNRWAHCSHGVVVRLDSGGQLDADRVIPWHMRPEVAELAVEMLRDPDEADAS